jgi:hypothetical protein
VANVVVHLKAPPGFAFKMPDLDALKQLPNEAVLDQPHCSFLPHVLAVYAPHQKLRVHNSAPVTHNTKIVGMSLYNPEQNFTLGSGKDAAINLKAQPKEIDVACNFHPWMNGKIWAFDHPFFGVSKGHGPKDAEADFGTYEIKNVPAGIEVNVVVWHEAGGTQNHPMTLKEGETKVQDFKVK